MPITPKLGPEAAAANMADLAPCYTPQEAVIEADAEANAEDGEDEAAREPEEATAEAEPAEESEAEEQPAPAVSGGAEVVSLDAFRKKNG